MKRISLRKTLLVATVTCATFSLSACDPTAVSVGGSVYYDSMLWNDYYYGQPPRPPRPPRPDRPGKPVHPIAPPPRPVPPIARPPVARPPVARPPIHRPR